MHLLQALLNFRIADQPLGDAVCSVALVPKKPPHQHQDGKAGTLLLGAPRGSAPASTASAAFSFKSFKLPGAGSSNGSTDLWTPAPLDGDELLSLLPPLATQRVWAELDDADKRSVRCVARSFSAFGRCVSGLQVMMNSDQLGMAD